jgi:hypothetical protein
LDCDCRGQERDIQINTMNDQTPITDDQRKAFANLIREAQQRYEKEFDNRFKSLKDSYIPRFEAGSKAKQVIEQIRSLREKLSEASDQLRRLGFRVVDDGFVSVDYDSSGQPYREFEDEKNELAAERESALDSFRRSVFNVWSARTADEAREIVRSLNVV